MLTRRPRASVRWDRGWSRGLNSVVLILTRLRLRGVGLWVVFLDVMGVPRLF